MPNSAQLLTRSPTQPLAAMLTDDTDLGGANWPPAGANFALDFERGLFYGGGTVDTLAMSPLGYVETGQGATNLQNYSRGFDGTAWVKTGCTIGTGFADPDGGTNARKIEEDTSNGNHWIVPAVGSLSFLVDQQIIASIDAQADERGWLGIETFSPSFTTNFYAFFDLVNGVIGSVVGATPDGAYVSSAIENLGGGWYRCDVIGKPSVAATAGYFAVFSATGDGATSYQGETGKGIRIYEANITQTAARKPTIYSPNGNAVSQAASGQSWMAVGTEAAAVPVIIGGRLTNSTISVSQQAGYFPVRSTGGPIRRLGARFEFKPNGGGNGGAAAIITSNDYFISPFPNSGFHLTISKTDFALSSVIAGAFNSYASGSLPIALQPGRLYDCDVLFDLPNSSALLRLPGVNVPVSDPAIATYAGAFATIEQFQTNASIDDRPAFARAWAA